MSVDLASGRRHWSFGGGGDDSHSRFLYRSPAVAGARVFFGDSRAQVHALDVESGGLIWTRALDAPISTGILAIGGDLVLADEQGTAYRIAQATGSPRSRMRLGAAFQGPPIALADSLVMFAGESGFACLDLSTERVRWTRNLPLSSSRPYPWRGALLGATNDELIAFRGTDGLPLWSRKFAGVIRGIGHDERTLYLGTQQGMIYAYRRGGSDPGPR